MRRPRAPFSFAPQKATETRKSSARFGHPAARLKRSSFWKAWAASANAVCPALVGIVRIHPALRRAPDRAASHAVCQRELRHQLKIGALVRVSVRRIKIAMASSCPVAEVWGWAAVRLNGSRPNQWCSSGSPSRARARPQIAL